MGNHRGGEKLFYSRKIWYAEYYSKFSSSAISGSKSFSLMHKFLESGETDNRNHKILEIGANRGEHFDFVKKPFLSYTMTDIQDNSALLAEKNLPPNVKFEVANCESLPYPDHAFSKVIITCVLHHLEKPLQAIQEVRRVTAPGGVILILLPNDPSIVYRLLRSLSSGFKQRRAGLKELGKFHHAMEHRNHYLSLMQMSKYVFQEDTLEIVSLPFGIENYSLNLISKIKVLRSNSDSPLIGE